MLQLIAFFQEMQYLVHFGTTASESGFTPPLKKMGVKLLSIALNDATFDRQIKKMAPDIVVYDRFMTEEQFGWRVRDNVPNAVTILDTEDLHFLRKAREVAFTEQSDIDLYTNTCKRELASVLRSDLSLIISKYEMRLLQNDFRIPEGKLQYLPLFAKPVDKPKTFSERQHFLTFGNFQHAPNLDAVHCLHKDVWPELHKKLPEAELHVYGAYAPKEITDLHAPKTGFYIEGWVGNLEACVAESKVVLAPLHFGAGLKGKVLQALALGTPVVSTNIGFEGIFPEGTYPGFADDTAQDFIQKAVALYTDVSMWESARETGISCIKEGFLETEFKTAFTSRIASLQADLSAHRKSHFLGEILHVESFRATKFMSKWIELKNKD